MKPLVGTSLVAVACLLLSSTMISQTLQSGFAEIEGRKVYYETKGEGAAVLFIHGFSLDTRMWDDLFDTFAKQYRAVRYDVSGYGRSTIPDSVISSSDEIAALLKSLHIDKATVIGMSQGGRVAIKFALDYPQMVDALITLSSALDGFQFSNGVQTRMKRYTTIAKDSGLAKAKEAWLKDPFLTPQTDAPSVRNKIRKIVTDWSGIQFSTPNLWSFKQTLPAAIHRLDKIKVPTLAIVGEKDEQDMHAIADTLVANIAGARKIVIAGSGHLLNLERADEFNKIVLDFLSTNVPHR
jgi:pimeloyl-ACP methyl ester carboxylesterase